jgi:hypothetical protein
MVSACPPGVIGVFEGVGAWAVHNVGWEFLHQENCDAVASESWAGRSERYSRGLRR